MSHYKPMSENMTLNEYQEHAMAIPADYRFKWDEKERVEWAALGLSSESGEFISLIKKHKFQGHELDINKLKAELSDILWYCSLAAEALGTDLNDIAHINITKLRERYPNSFTIEESINRKV
jgi:NTP pyrophosphatase (non-canonical NTP hydrolase)